MSKATRKSDPTLHDVAELAGVSFMTVSRALREPAKVSPQTRERVLEAIKEIGYVPNLAARSLVSSSSNLVTVVVPNLENLIFAQTIHGITDELRRNQLFLSISYSGYSLKEESDLIAASLQQRPCAIILHNTVHTAEAAELLRSCAIPVIETGDLSREPIDSVVSYSNFDAGRAATHHLAARGYRNIAFASVVKRDNIRIQERLRGYRAALKELGRPFRKELVHEGEIGPLSGAQLLADILRDTPDADAIFFAGERLAIGAVLECHRRGIRVPGRVAIIGFDDYDINQQVSPPLSAVAIPRYEIGRLAAQMVVSRVRGWKREPEIRDVGFRIVAREST